MDTTNKIEVPNFDTEAAFADLKKQAKQKECYRYKIISF